MTHEQKLQVRDALVRYVAGFESHSDAAASLNEVSQSLIANITNNYWDMISESAWHLVARQVGFYCGEWIAADTSTSLLLRILFSDAKNFALCYGISISAGFGKTFTASRYLREHENVFYAAGDPAHNRRSFMASLLRAMGIRPSGSVPQMIATFTNSMAESNEPLLIIDDAHKLKDRVLHLMLSLSNAMAGSVGIVLMGSELLQRKITGYNKIYNSFGQRFVTLTRLSPHDIPAVCRANGIDDDILISAIEEECIGNLHKIETLVARCLEMKIAA